MKKIITMICLVMMATCLMKGQDVSEEIGTKTEYINEVQSGKASLFLNAQTWATSNTTDRKVTIEASDKEAGTIILKVSEQLPRTSGINTYSIIKVQMNVRIDCRDNKYRVSFYNFTSTVQPDNTVESEFLSTKNLQNQIKELEMVTRLSEKDFGKEMYWGLEKMISAREKYKSQNERYKEQIGTFDSSTKKGQKEIQYRKDWISENDEYVNYLNYILKGFGGGVTNVYNSLSKAMNVSDDC